jgi:hypothetical protein
MTEVIFYCQTCGAPEGSLYRKPCCTADNMITDATSEEVADALFADRAEYLAELRQDVLDEVDESERAQDAYERAYYRES